MRLREVVVCVGGGGEGERLGEVDWASQARSEQDK